MKRPLTFILLLAAILLPNLCGRAAVPRMLFGCATEVVEWRTIRVQLATSTEKVCLLGVDIPVIANPPAGGDPRAAGALDYVSRALTGKPVWLEPDVEERDGRGDLLAYIWLVNPEDDGAAAVRAGMLNAALVLEGYAKAGFSPPNLKYREIFAGFEAEASAAGKGLWGQSASVAAEIEITVYVTKSGTRYHRAGCRYLKGGSSPLKLSEAKARGLKACGVCKPPG